MQVDCSRADAGVPQEFLDVQQVGTAVQQVGCEAVPDGVAVRAVERVGKKAAGRELDGRTWDQYPGGAS